MKAQVSSIIWTLLVILFVLVAFFFVTISSILMELGILNGGGGGTTTKIEFVEITSRPYIIANVLSKYEAGGRNFLEYAAETMVTKSSSGQSLDDVSEFIDYYGLDYYYVSITNETGAVFSEIKSIPERCGDNGFCEKKLDPYIDPAINEHTRRCNIGSEMIRGLCSFGSKICCKENVDANGNYNMPEGRLCSNKKGICSIPYDGKKRCGNGRVEVATDECKNKEVSGFTTDVCCMPVSEESLKTVGITAAAEIPLLFSDKFGLMRISVG